MRVYCASRLCAKKGESTGDNRKRAVRNFLCLSCLFSLFFSTHDLSLRLSRTIVDWENTTINPGISRCRFLSSLSSTGSSFCSFRIAQRRHFFKSAKCQFTRSLHWKMPAHQETLLPETGYSTKVDNASQCIDLRSDTVSGNCIVTRFSWIVFGFVYWKYLALFLWFSFKIVTSFRWHYRPPRWRKRWSKQFWEMMSSAKIPLSISSKRGRFLKIDLKWVHSVTRLKKRTLSTLMFQWNWKRRFGKRILKCKCNFANLQIIIIFCCCKFALKYCFDTPSSFSDVRRCSGRKQPCLCCQGRWGTCLQC